MHCTDARMKLRDLPLATAIRDERHSETIGHYAACTKCRPIGIAPIKRLQISCQEAIATCLRGECLLYDAHLCETLQELAAHEHVYGAHVVNAGKLAEPRIAGITSNECTADVCTFVRSIWNNAGLCMHYDGDEEEEHGTEWTIDKASREGWPIEPLFQALRDRRAFLENKARSSQEDSKQQYLGEIASIDATLANFA